MKHERVTAAGRSDTTNDELVSHCGTLGLGGGEDREAIQKAFRKRARVTHPDITRDDGQEFKEAYGAYEALTADAERAVDDAATEAVEAPGVRVFIVRNTVAPILPT